MRVLMISKACVVGAYQKKLEELARLPDLELAVIVPPYWREGRNRLPLERLHLQGYQLTVSPIAFNGHFHLHFYPKLADHLRAFRPDILHVDEEPYNLATFQAIRLGKRYGAKSLFFTWQNLYRRYPFPFSAIERYCFRTANYALAGNQEAAEVLRAKGYSGPLEVIPQFGVDPEMFCPAADVRGSAGAPEFRIGYVGRLVPEKGVDLLIRAAAKLAAPWHLVIIGDGPERAALERLADALGVSHRVSIQARIPSAQMPNHLQQFDVLVLPSRTRPNWKEQFGRILVEAMSCEVPVIGSMSGEIPNVIGEAGLLFPEGDVERLRAALEAVRAAADRRARWGRAGRQRVLSLFTQAEIARRTYEVYRKLS